MQSGWHQHCNTGTGGELSGNFFQSVTGAKDDAILIGHKLELAKPEQEGWQKMAGLFGGACLREQNPLIGPMCWPFVLWYNTSLYGNGHRNALDGGAMF